MYRFAVRFFNGRCEVFRCKDIRGVRYLAKMCLVMRKKDIDMMVCDCDGDFWKWRRGKWEKKKCKDK